MGRAPSKPAPDLSPRVKVILMGSPSVGKTSLVVYHEHGSFSIERPSSAECQLYQFLETVGDTRTRTVVMDSLSDQDLQAKIPCRLKSIRNADCAIVVIDYGNEESLATVREKLEALATYEYLSREVLLVANKSDLDDRKISDDAVLSLIRSVQGFKIHYLRTSCKTGVGVKALFTRATEVGLRGPRLKWEARKSFLWVYDQVLQAEGDTQSAAAMVFGAGLCQAIPGYFSRRSRKRIPSLSKLPQSVLLLVFSSLF